LNPRTTIFRLPDDLPTESVIGAGCALITAIHGVERLCSDGQALQGTSGMPSLPGPYRDWVVVQGAGPVGIAALAVAREAGAANVIVVGGPKHRLEMAQRFGATHLIALEDLREAKDRIEAVRALTGGHGADAVLECVGHPSAVTEGLEMCRDGGRYLVLGHYCNAGPAELNPHIITRKQLQIYGSWSSEPRHLRAAIEFLGARRQEFPFAAMVTHRFPLIDANDALATTARLDSAKSVIVPDLASR
jgi:5-exo-hydroxycamphor dehydrogenase